jgi:hypothetical protein
MRGNEEIELAPGERVDDGSGQPDVQILGRLVTRRLMHERPGDPDLVYKTGTQV